jgi:hypothetical protein
MHGHSDSFSPLERAKRDRQEERRKIGAAVLDLGYGGTKTQCFRVLIMTVPQRHR